ncbi:beta strand repeat-containing protein, partial [Pandoraea sp. NPDC090278]|uniref:beta strand repeat-containing protein n=1 Tax=Pandoraea sp. NPDC090278 TaxID=3364391 RepID=UPI00383AAFF2
GNITVNAGITGTGNGSLTLIADRNISLAAPIILSGGSNAQLNLNATNLSSSAVGTISTTGGLTLNISGLGQMNGGISFTGGLNVNGTGIVTLGANNTYTGNTSINNGTLIVAGGAISGAGGVTIAANGTLQVGNGTANGALAALSGAGGIWNYGNLVFNQASGNTTRIDRAFRAGSTGNVTQSGVNTTVALGAIDTAGLSGGSAIGSGWLTVNAGLFDLGTSTNILGGPNNNGSLTGARVNSGGTLTASLGAVRHFFQLILDGGTLSSYLPSGVSSAQALVWGSYLLNGNITVLSNSSITAEYLNNNNNNSFFIANNATLNFSGSMITASSPTVPTRSMTLTGPGRLLVLGQNSYDANGTIYVNCGTLQVGNGGTTGTLGLAKIVNNGTFIINRSDAVSLSSQNIVEGTGNTTIIGGCVTTAASISQDGAVSLTATNGSIATTGSIVSNQSTVSLNASGG